MLGEPENQFFPTRIALSTSGHKYQCPISKPCVDLGGAGKNINDDIAALVAKGLPVQVQQSPDIVRVIGNNTVHLRQIDCVTPGLSDTSSVF